MAEEKWEKETIEKLLFATIKEQRAARRWRIFFRLIGLILIVVVAILTAKPGLLGNAKKENKDAVALIHLIDPIFSTTDASAERINSSLLEAFKNINTKAVIIKINSPGGSPTQSALIYDEIKRLRVLYPAIKVYAVVEDSCASGAYYIASAADEIYANRNSMVGSIGVLIPNYDFTGLMDKYGVKDRTIYSGKYKTMLSPTRAATSEEINLIQNYSDAAHRTFIADVKAGRGDRLAKDPVIFTGLVWDGNDAKALGLIDGFGDVGSVARDIIGIENIVEYTYNEQLFSKVFSKLQSSISIGVKQAFSVY